MLLHSPQPLSQPDELAVAEFLSHKGRAILDRVIRGQIAAYVNRANDLILKSPLDVLAKGPENPKARELNIQAAKFQIFLDMLAEFSKPETKFEFSKFDVE